MVQNNYCLIQTKILPLFLKKTLKEKIAASLLKF